MYVCAWVWIAWLGGNGADSQFGALTDSMVKWWVLTAAIATAGVAQFTGGLLSLPAHLIQCAQIVRQVGENHALFVVVLAQYFVFVQVKAITDAKPANKRKNNRKKWVRWASDKKRNQTQTIYKSKCRFQCLMCKWCALNEHWKGHWATYRHTLCTLQLIFTSIRHFTNWNCANKPLNRLYHCCWCCYSGALKQRLWAKWASW